MLFLEDYGTSFPFLQYLFSRFWTPFRRKLMKRPAVFITYFENLFEIVHVQQVLNSEYFFRKFDGRSKIMAIFLLSTTFARKLIKWPDNFITYFRSFYRYIQIFVVWKNFKIKWQLFQNVNDLLFIFAIFSNICNKTYEKTYNFFLIPWKFNFTFMSWQNFMIRKLKKKKSHLFQYENKILFISASLYNIFHKIIKNPAVFVTYFLSLF